MFAEQSSDFVGDLAGVEGSVAELQLSSFNLGKIENVIEQPEQHLPGVVYRACILKPFLFAEPRHQQQLRHAENPVHRGPDLVRHRRQESTLGMVGRLGVVLCLNQFLLGLFAVGNIFNNRPDILFAILASNQQAAISRSYSS